MESERRGMRKGDIHVRGHTTLPVPKPPHLIQYVELEPAFGEINVTIRKEILIADVNKRQILQNQSTVFGGQKEKKTKAKT
jgi:hypothetical protein